MRVAVVYFGASEKLSVLAQAYAEGVTKQGHSVTTIDGLKESVNLFVYEYLILGTEPMSLFSSKIDIAVWQNLKNMGHIDGRATYAFLLKKGLGANRSLQLWMKWLESCGLLLMLSDIVVRASEAKYIGERIHIYK